MTTFHAQVYIFGVYFSKMPQNTSE